MFYRISHLNKIKVPVEEVYKVLTTHKGLSKIWTENLKVKDEVGFINEFDFGERYLTKMKITDLEKSRRVSWECLESDEEWVGTTVTFEMNFKNGYTELTLEHAGWRRETPYFI